MAKKKFEVTWEERHKAIVEIDIDRLKGFWGDQFSEEVVIDEAERLAIEEAEDTYQEIIDIETAKLSG